MKRLAIWYEGARLGRNDGNPVYVWHDLKSRKDMYIDHIAPNGDYRCLGSYDASIWVDWGEDGLTGILPYKVDFPPPGRPLIYWASDTHLGYDYRLECAKQADIVFVAQHADLLRFQEAGVKNAHWLPHAFEPTAYPYEINLSKKYAVCFIGHINSKNRINAIDRLFKEFPNFFYGQRQFEEAAEKYHQSKVCFNIAMKEDLNMRCFEVMGSGSFLLTDRLPDLEKLFKDGIHCVMYDNEQDMIDKARYYIEHDEEREKIARSGYEECIKNHTIHVRVDRMLEELNKLKGV